MAFTNWVQKTKFIQTNFYSPIVAITNGIKLIFGGPNIRPFRKSTVDITFKQGRVKINT